MDVKFTQIFVVVFGCRQRNCDLFKSSDSEEDLTRKYFKYGYNYQTIYLFLERFHGSEISLRTLKRRLTEYVFKKASTDISDKTFNKWAGS